MKKKLVAITLTTLVALSIAVLTAVQAQEPEPSATAHTSSDCPCMKGEMRGKTMGHVKVEKMVRMEHGKMGSTEHGRMGRHGGMMGLCPMTVPGAKVDVKAVDNGVTITVTAEDANAVRRIQRLAELRRLMHELHSEQ
jgi:uncharacterized protein involved in copper resistance